MPFVTTLLITLQLPLCNSPAPCIWKPSPARPLWAVNPTSFRHCRGHATPPSLLCANQLLNIHESDSHCAPGPCVTVDKWGARRPWRWSQSPPVREQQAAPHPGKMGKARAGGRRSWEHQGRSGKRMGRIGNEWEDVKGRSEKEGRQPGKTAALRNITIFMCCVVGLPGEEPPLDRVRAPGTNWEVLNYPPQHREAMK